MSDIQLFPRTTGRDIFLEANDRRIAAVASCETQARRDGAPVVPFGAGEGQAAGLGPMQYTIRLSRLSPERGEADLFALSGFALVIQKPEARIAYEGCEWLSISEKLTPHGCAVEEAVVLALTRRVSPAERGDQNA